MSSDSWVVSAAILLDKEQGLHVTSLAQLVMDSGLTRLGVKNVKGVPSQTLRSQLAHSCPHTEWFTVVRNHVTLVNRKAAALNSEVRAVFEANSKWAAGKGVKNGPALPEEILETGLLLEGTKKSIEINAYERNPIARNLCLAYYGPICVVCGFKASAVYGPLIEGLIHIHHIIPLSKIAERYEVDPIEDLRPVCPNCHAAIHWGGACRTIEEVKSLCNPG